MLEGILLPRPLAAALEAIFKGISDTINETSYTADGRTFWSMLQVYTYDPVRDDLRACKYTHILEGATASPLTGTKKPCEIFPIP